MKLRKIHSNFTLRQDLNKGYTDQWLNVDLKAGVASSHWVSESIKQLFIGGKGYDLWLLWNNAVRVVKKKGSMAWDDEENAICIASGPMGGTPGFPGAGKSIVTSISPLTGLPIDSNVGGNFGPFLKFCGFDAMKISGKAEQEVIVYIDGDLEGGKVNISVHGADADLPDDSYELSKKLSYHFGEGDPKNISVITAGPAAKHSLMGCLNFTWYDLGRKTIRYKQAGRGGIGTVMADKGLRAVVIRSPKFKLDTNNPADPEALKTVIRKYTAEIKDLDPKQNEMSVLGTTHLVTIMNDHNCLPVMNFRFGSHPLAHQLGGEAFRKMFHKGFDGCWKGCSIACAHMVKDFVPKTGPYAGQKVDVDGPEYETIGAFGSNLGIFSPHFVVEANFYCDAYGLDTISAGVTIGFLMDMFDKGIIDEDFTGGLDMSFGNRESALEVLHQMARGDEFGKIAGLGIKRLQSLIKERCILSEKQVAYVDDAGMVSKGLEFSLYITKRSLAQQGGYGFALKGPQHDEAWLIFLDMVKKLMPTFEQKAENLFWFPMFRTWFGLCGLCKLPWNDVTPADNMESDDPAKVIKHVEWYADFFNAVTGRKETAEGLIAMSERVYNFQRIFDALMSKKKMREIDQIPARAMCPIDVQEYEHNKLEFDLDLIEMLDDTAIGDLRSLLERFYDEEFIERVGALDDSDVRVSEMLSDFSLYKKKVDRWLEMWHEKKEEIVGAKLSVREKVDMTRKFREQKYEGLKDVVYTRRGWRKDGVPSVRKVRQLGLDQILGVMDVVKGKGKKK